MKQVIKLYNTFTSFIIIMMKHRYVPYNKYIRFIHVIVVGLLFSLWSCSRMDIGMGKYNYTDNQGECSSSGLPKLGQANRWEILRQELCQELALAEKIEHIIRSFSSSSSSLSGIALRYTRIAKIASGAMGGFLFGIMTEALVSYYMHANCYQFPASLDEMDGLLTKELSGAMLSVLEFRTRNIEKGDFFTVQGKLSWYQTSLDMNDRHIGNVYEAIVEGFCNALGNLQEMVIKRTLRGCCSLLLQKENYLPFIQATLFGIVVTGGYSIGKTILPSIFFAEKQSNKTLEALADDIKCMYRLRREDSADIEKSPRKAQCIKNIRKNLEWVCRNLPFLVENIQISGDPSAQRAVQERLENLLLEIRKGTYGVYDNKASCSSRRDTLSSREACEDLPSHSWLLSRCDQEVSAALGKLMGIR